MRRALAELVGFGQRSYGGDRLDAYMLGLRIGLDLCGRSPATGADLLEDLDAEHDARAARVRGDSAAALASARITLEELALRVIEVNSR